MSNHIRSIVDLDKSWCGQLLSNEFYFKETDQVLMNALYAPRIKTCLSCTQTLIAVLMDGVAIDGLDNKSIV